MRISDWSSDVCSSDLVVPAGAGTIGYLQTIARHSRRLAAICNGAFILAQAGLLAGRRATTHWASARLLRERFPAVQVDEDRIFIADGRSEEHTSELQSLMRISYAVCCLKQKNNMSHSNNAYRK